MQTQEIILKLVAVADTNKTFGSDEEEQYYTMATSDITDTPKKKALHHERMISFPGIHSLFSGIDFPKHKLSPSCPTIGQGSGLRYIPKDVEKLSIQTVVTDQLTEFSEDDVNDDLILLIGQDIEVKEPLSNILCHDMMDCSEVYKMIQQPTSLDLFLKVWRDINSKCPNGINQYASSRFEYDLVSSALKRHLAVCKQLAASANFLCSILCTVAGFIFMIGACELKVSDLFLSNLFLSGSCLYIWCSTYSLFQAWKSANRDWNRIQFCRRTLCQRAGCITRTTN